jgi:hypothetical protein
MRPIITIDANGHLISTLIDNDGASPSIAVGTRFTFHRPYETPWGEVPTGITATVIETVDATGELDLEVEEKVPALFMWSGLLILLPFMSEDLSACLKLLS